MIKIAKELEMGSNEELFQYVVDSDINGQPSQVRELIKSIKASRAIVEFKEFLYLSLSDSDQLEFINRYL